MAAVAVLLVAMLALLGVFAFQVLQVVEEVTADHVDCEYEIEYGECSETCGDGIKQGTVTITTEASNGGECSYEDGDVVTQSCKLRDCETGNAGPDEPEEPEAFEFFEAQASNDGVCSQHLEFTVPNSGTQETLYSLNFASVNDANKRLAEECLCNDDCEGFYYSYSNNSADVTLCETNQLDGQAPALASGVSRYMFLKNNFQIDANDKTAICDGYTSIVDELIQDEEEEDEEEEEEEDEEEEEEEEEEDEEDEEEEETHLGRFVSNKSYCRPRLSAQCAAGYLDFNTWYQNIDGITVGAVAADSTVNFMPIYEQKYSRARLFDSTRNKCGSDRTELCESSINWTGMYSKTFPSETKQELQLQEYASGCQEFGPQLGDQRDYKLFPGVTSPDELDEQAATACLEDPECRGFFYNNSRNSPQETPVFFCEEDPKSVTTTVEEEYMNNFVDNDNSGHITMYGLKFGAERLDPEQGQEQTYVDTHYQNGGDACGNPYSVYYNRCDASNMSFEDWKNKYYPQDDHTKANGASDRYDGLIQGVSYGGGDTGLKNTWARRAIDLHDNATTLTDDEKEHALNACIATYSGCNPKKRYPCTEYDNAYLTRIGQYGAIQCDLPGFYQLGDLQEDYHRSYTSTQAIDTEGQKRILYYEDREYCESLDDSEKIDETFKMTGTFASEDDLKHKAAIACSNRELCQGFIYQPFVSGEENQVELCQAMNPSTDPRQAQSRNIVKNTLCQDTLDAKFPELPPGTQGADFNNWMRDVSNARSWCQVNGRYPNKGTNRCNDALKACNTPCAETLRTMADSHESLQAFDFSITQGDATRQGIYDWAKSKGGNVASTLRDMCI